MKILVTGGNGQLGRQFRDESSRHPELDFTFIDIGELDITSSRAVSDFFNTHRYDAIINCAAYTNVDGAEDDHEGADALNSDGVRNIASSAAKQGSLLIHISTDYVFNGRNHIPYTEEDLPSPESAYGKSKLKGEKEIMKISGNMVILRTSWLFSTFGHNFVKTINSRSHNQKELKVVFDQVGNPTYAGDLAEAAIEIARRQNKMQGVRIYHFSNEGVCSWYDFARAIVEMNGTDCKVIPVRSEEYPQKAPRPSFSILDKSKIKEETGITIPHWRESLKTVISNLNV
jgi:dTDP-4-dehydrorhamnose reductase